VIVVIKVVGIVRKIRLDDVGPTVMVVVGCIDSHSSLFTTVCAVCDTRLSPSFGETALTVVVVEHAG
jgi:ribulose kinase